MPQLAGRKSVIRLDTADGSIEFRCGSALFRFAGNGFAVGEVDCDGESMQYLLSSPRFPLAVRAVLRFATDGNPELRLRAEGPMPLSFDYPGALLAQRGDVALFPAGEGFAFPVDDPSLPLLPESAWMGSQTWHMAMIASLRGEAWVALAPEEGVDASVRNERLEGLLRTQLCWEAQQGEWGYERVVRFLGGDSGGLNAFCAAYRRFRESLGLVTALREKRKRLPSLDRLIGAPEFWIWPDNYENFMYGTAENAELTPAAPDLVRIAEELKAGGCRKALMGIFFAGDRSAAREITERTGFLTAKYDNMEDELPGDVAPLIPPARIRECDYTERRMKYWPGDTIRNGDGGFAGAWALRGRDGVMYSQNRTCPSFVEKYTREEVPDAARRYGFSAWFFDVMGCGASECASPEHPLTRRECVRNRRAAFRVLEENGLIAGTEEGGEPYLSSFCYCEGKMSPALYRINYRESGRRKAHRYTPEEHEALFDTFMLNPRYRIPLWELVYHDCAVNYWYWGDSSNCCPELLPRRDLFNVLYGQPPLYSFSVSEWPVWKARLLESAARASRSAERTGYERMLSFEYLGGERLVQRTTFANGVSVTVNFSEEKFRLESGRTLPPGTEWIEDRMEF